MEGNLKNIVRKKMTLNFLTKGLIEISPLAAFTIYDDPYCR